MPDTANLSKEDLDSILPWNLIRATRLATKNLTEALAPFEITPVQFGVLTQLSASGSMTQAQLSRAVIIRAQSLAPLLTELENKDFITRGKYRQQGKPNAVELTPTGAELLEHAWQAALTTNDLSNQGISAASGNELNSLLLRIINNEKPTIK